MSIDTFDNNENTSRIFDSMKQQTHDLAVGANAFSRAMTSAFTASVVGGKQFDDVLKSLTLRISDLAVRLAFRPLERSITGGIESLLSGLTGVGNAAGVSAQSVAGGVNAFASGGVIGTPTYFPMMQGVGLAGEAGPEAIMPLRRGPDGRLGISGHGGGNHVTIQIATPDLESFRRSESYITGQIARAVSRGQRSL